MTLGAENGQGRRLKRGYPIMGGCRPNAAGRTFTDWTCELRWLCEDNDLLLSRTIIVFISPSVAILAQGGFCTLLFKLRLHCRLYWYCNITYRL